ncbi:MAG: DNA polymerase III subunit delta' [Anaerolineaceae bacterium]
MTWKLLGHEQAIAYLKQHSHPEKTRHAYLITGPEGVGKRTLALAFVKALNCTQPPSQGEFCGECTTCRQIDMQAFPDLTVLTPEPGKDLRIEQIRTMQQTLALAPYQSRYRIVMILNFHHATASASNALLKSLEEPPSRAILILTADAAESLLPTIASRCEVLRLRPQPVDVAAEGLSKQFGIASEMARRYAHLTSGRIGAALRLERDPQSLNVYEEALDLLEELLPAKQRERLNSLDGLMKSKSGPREAAATLVPAWLTWWRDCLMVNAGADVPLVNLNRQPQIAKVAGQVSGANLRGLLESHEAALGQIESYVNARLLIENLVLSLPRVQVG